MSELDKNLKEYISNFGQLNLDKTKYYAAILGESPSKGARSPVLWNAAFKGLGVSALMHPMDIKSKDLQAALAALRGDSHFIGGAVTMPYKLEILPFLDRLEPEAEVIGAVNCVYRDGDALIGANTDGAGAIESLQAIQSLNGKTICLLGTGGAGLAVAVYAAKAVGKEGKIVLSNRTRITAELLGEKLAGICQVSVEDFPVSKPVLEKSDVIINCTLVGFQGEMEKFSPLAATQKVDTNQTSSRELLAGLKNKTVFDIVYQPRETVFIKLAKEAGLKTLGGLGMNLGQAVIGFQKAVSKMVGNDSKALGRVQELMAGAR